MLPGESPDTNKVSTGMKRARIYSFALDKPPSNVPAGANSAKSKVEVWQIDAFNNHDAISEIAFANTLMANVFSRGYLRVVELDATTERGGMNYKPTNNKQALDFLADLASVSGSHTPILYSFAMNLLIAGDCYLLGVPQKRGGKVIKFKWEVVSILELKTVRGKGGGDVVVRVNGDGTETELPSDIKVYRCHKRDPRYASRADSPMKHNGKLCEEVILLSDLINILAQSRMNAGVFCVADELSFGPEDETADESDDELDPLSKKLLAQFVTVFKNIKDPSAVAPMLMRGAKEYLPNQDSYITFGREFDETLVQLRNDGLTRIFRSLDIPVENITGKGQTSSWSAYAVEQDFVDKHIKPLGMLVADFLTEQYLRPFLEANGVTDEDVSKFAVLYDESDISTKPDMTKSAMELRKLNAISDSALRRYCGVDESDAPTEEERKEMIAVQMSALSAELAALLLKLVPGFEGVELIPPSAQKPDTPQGADSKAKPKSGDVGNPKDTVPTNKNSERRGKGKAPDGVDSPSKSAGN